VSGLQVHPGVPYHHHPEENPLHCHSIQRIRLRASSRYPLNWDQYSPNRQDCLSYRICRQCQNPDGCCPAPPLEVVSIDLKVSGLGFISTSVLLRLGVELVDSLYASNGAKSGFGRLSGDVWRLLYEQGGDFECVDGDIGWLASNLSSLTLGGFFSTKGRK